MRDNVTVRYSFAASDALHLSMELRGKVEEVTISGHHLVQGLPLVQLEPSPFRLAEAQLRDLEVSEAYVYLKLQEPHGRACEVEILREGVNTLVYVNRQLFSQFKPPV